MTTKPVLTSLVSFDGDDGRSPEGGLIADAQGDLFGTTNVGGADDYGAVFEIVNTGTAAAPVYASKPKTLVSFDFTDGGEPSGDLIADANGDLFGTTSAGGPAGDGTIYEIVNTGTPAAPTYAATPTILASFDGPNGREPLAGLVADAHGDLFGTTASGGAYGTAEGSGAAGYGTVFEIINTGTAAAPVYATAPTVLVSFDGADGSYPTGALIADAHGDLFGTTTGHSADRPGTVFEIINTGTAAAPVYASAPTVLVTFARGIGVDPRGALIADAHGDLFGTTANPDGTTANNAGTVFEVVNTGTTAAPVYASAPKTLASFDGADGAHPMAGLIADAKGDLFGTTESGGAHNDGTLFEIVNTSAATAPVYASAAKTLISFDGLNGRYPDSSLIADANGDLFGTTTLGGSSADGNAFELSNAFQVVAISGAGGVIKRLHQTIRGASMLADVSSGSTISIYDGSTLLGTTTVAANGTWSASVTLSSTQGGHSLTAVATNILGNVVSSAPVTYTYDRIAPRLAITSSGGFRGLASTKISGTIVAAEAGLTVSIYSGSTLIGTTTAAADGTWTASVTLLTRRGPQSITAVATDAENLIGTSAAASYTLADQYVSKSAVSGGWSFAGTGTDVISGASDLEFGSRVASGQTIDFSGLGGELMLADPHAFAGEIKGFHNGDAIEIAGALSDFHAAHETGGVFLSFMDAGHLDRLTLVGSYSASHFSEGGGIIKYT